MAQKSSGMRHGTRKKLSGGSGGGRIRDRLRGYEDGDRVVIDVDASVQDGMPHPRFHGRTGTVQERRGRAYVVAVQDGGQEKQFTVDPVHLAPAE